MKTAEEQRTILTEMIKFADAAGMVPRGRKINWNFRVAGIRQYRGRKPYVVGYSWSRPYSGHATGKVYERILGRGYDFESAVADANARIAKTWAGQIHVPVTIKES